jgi:hypothetical protein
VASRIGGQGAAALGSLEALTASEEVDNIATVLDMGNSGYNYVRNLYSVISISDLSYQTGSDIVRLTCPPKTGPASMLDLDAGCPACYYECRRYRENIREEVLSWVTTRSFTRRRTG